MGQGKALPTIYVESNSSTMRILLQLLGLIFFVFLVPDARADFSGPVVSVLDGDTFEVLHNQHPECIRLSGIGLP